MFNLGYPFTNIEIQGKLMKYFLLLFVTYSALANEVETCQKFKKEVLEHAAYADKGDFYRDNKKALSYISKYDPKKLGIDLNFQKMKLEITDCKAISVVVNEKTYCETSFQNKTFLSGLMGGMTRYKWPASTVKRGKEKIFEYFNFLKTHEMNLIDVLTGFYVIKYYFTAFPDKKIDLNSLEQFKQKMDAEILSFGDKYNLPSQKCEMIQAKKKEELQIAENLRHELSEILNNVVL